MPHISPLMILFFPVLIFSLVCHEVGHAWVAWKAGDDTAQKLGRITLNPLAHVDPIGTILMPILQLITSIPLIGWAKPVPINPARFRKSIWRIYVALAGVTMNLILVLTATLCLRIYCFFEPRFFELVVAAINAPELTVSNAVLLMLIGCVVVNLSLILFNLLPIPPLDGSHIVLYFIRDINSPLGRAFVFVERFGFFILLALLYFRVLNYILEPLFLLAIKGLLAIFFFPKGLF